MADIAKLSDLDSMSDDQLRGELEKIGVKAKPKADPLADMSDDQLRAELEKIGVKTKEKQVGSSDWQKFKAGLSAIAQDPSLLFHVGPLKPIGSGVEVTGEALRGELPAYPSEQTPEQAAKISDMASLAPGAPRGLMTRPAPSAPIAPPAPPAPSPFVEAVTRQGLADVTPKFIATDSRAVQALAQAGKQSPIGGPTIERASDRFVRSAADRAEQIASDVSGTGAKAAAPQVGADIREGLQGVVNQREAEAALARAVTEGTATRGIQDAEGQAQQAVQTFQGLAPTPRSRSAVGAEITRSLEDSLDAHSAAMGEPYHALRSDHIDSLQPVPEAQEPLRGVISRVLADRMNAGEGANVPAALRPVAELMQRRGGPNFDALQRARSRLGEVISDFDPHQGYAKGDLRAAYGALTEAMQIAAERSARNDPQEAVAALGAANENFSTRLDRMADIRSALRSGPEALVDRFLQQAGERGGANVERLTGLLQELPAPVRENVQQLALQRMARGPTGEFSDVALARNWANVSPEGRAALFGERTGAIDAAVQQVGGTRGAADVTRGLLESAARTQGRAIQAGARDATAEAASLLSRSDEQIVETLLHWAKGGGGADTGKLARIAGQMGGDQLRGLASVAVDRLGRNATDGSFSPAYFRKNWSKLSDGGKALLFPDATVRRSLDDMALISERVATAQAKYANHSNTARAGLAGYFGARFFAEPVSVIAGAGGSLAFSKLVSQPITAQPLAAWAKAYEASVRQPSAKTLHAVSSAAGRLSSAAGRAGIELDPQILVNQAAVGLTARGEPPPSSQRRAPATR